MSLEILSPGLWSALQDKGRVGYAQYGVPQSGVMDRYAAKVANLLVGNREEEAVMEITMLGPKLRFRQEALVAVSGLGARIFYHKKNVELNKPFVIERGGLLHIERVTAGVRCYLAVRGGFQTDEVLGSRSFFSSVTPAKKLKKGDILPLSPESAPRVPRSASLKFAKRRYSSKTLTAGKGPEFNRLTDLCQRRLTQQSFRVSKNNTRQAYQLKESLINKLPPILTQPVLPGTVQLTPAGNIIILMRDAQTTGGYPRILQLHEQSINRLAQKRAGDELQFTIVD